MKKLLLINLLFFVFNAVAQDSTKQMLDSIINQWHDAAAHGDSTVFFDLMDQNAIYIGTAPGERWTKKQFKKFAMPYFREGDAWDFDVITRHWNFNSDSTMAWFDETLKTWMEPCRSTGILKLENHHWKMHYYHLSVMIENDKIKKFIKLRKSHQD